MESTITEFLSGRPVHPASFFTCPLGRLACPNKQCCPFYSADCTGAHSLGVEGEFQSPLGPGLLGEAIQEAPLPSSLTSALVFALRQRQVVAGCAPSFPVVLVRDSQAWSSVGQIKGISHCHSNQLVPKPRFKNRTQVSMPRPRGLKQPGEEKAATHGLFSQTALCPPCRPSQQVSAGQKKRASLLRRLATGQSCS